MSMAAQQCCTSPFRLLTILTTSMSPSLHAGIDKRTASFLVVYMTTFLLSALMPSLAYLGFSLTSNLMLLIHLNLFFVICVSAWDVPVKDVQTFGLITTVTRMILVLLPLTSQDPASQGCLRLSDSTPHQLMVLGRIKLVIKHHGRPHSVDFFATASPDKHKRLVHRTGWVSFPPSKR